MDWQHLSAQYTLAKIKEMLPVGQALRRIGISDMCPHTG